MKSGFKLMELVHEDALYGMTSTENQKTAQPERRHFRQYNSVQNSLVGDEFQRHPEISLSSQESGAESRPVPSFPGPNAVHQSHFSILSELYPLLILYGVLSIFCEIELQLLGNGIMLCHSLVVQLWVRDLNSENLRVSHLKEEKNNAACLARC